MSRVWRDKVGTTEKRGERMPIKRIREVEDSKIVIEGLFSKDEAQIIFMDITNEHPTISMQYDYDQELDRTTIHFLPYRVYSIDMPPEVKKHVESDISFERKIVIPGIVASYDKIIEKLWVPARKRAKRNEDDLKWVVVTPRIVKDNELKTVTTEISFFIEVYNKNSHDPRGCKEENVQATLDRATGLMTEQLQEIVASDQSRILEANHVMDEVSMAFAESIDHQS